MKRVVLSLALISTVSFAGKNVAPAESASVPVSNVTNGIAIKAGTLGIGIDLSHKLNDTFSMRINVNGLRYNGYKRTIQGVDTTTDLKLFTAGVLLDYYPFDDSGFRLSGGVYYNGNKVTTHTGKITGDVTLNGNTYNNSTIDSIDGTLSFNTINPYIGVGYSNEITDGLSLVYDAGFMYHGKPQFASTVHYASGVSTATKANVESDKKKYVDDVNSKISKLQVYPVVMIGFAYRF